MLQVIQMFLSVQSPGIEAVQGIVHASASNMADAELCESDAMSEEAGPIEGPMTYMFTESGGKNRCAYTDTALWPGKDTLLEVSRSSA